MTKSARRMVRQRLEAAAYQYSIDPDEFSKAQLIGMLAVFECTDHSTATHRNRNLVRVIGELTQLIPARELAEFLTKVYNTWPELCAEWDRHTAAARIAELKRERKNPSKK